MKNSITCIGLLTCLALTACHPSLPQSGINQTALPTEDAQPYIKAYTDFLLHAEEIDQNDDFAFLVRGYYLFDLDFDTIPELGVFHDSLGSMGGYFTFYRFDGEKIRYILNYENTPARASGYTQILADRENKNVYFLKEMYLLQGNDNGTYGYVRKLEKDEDGIPYTTDILDLAVDQSSDLTVHSEHTYSSEDEFLSEPALDECLITRLFSDGTWKDISSPDYLTRKRELIPTENNFVDLRDTAAYYFGTPDAEAIDYEKNIQMTPDEINRLFSKWFEAIE